MTAPLPLYAVALGSNRPHAIHGTPRAVLLAALDRIDAPDMEIVAVSAIIDSAPLGPSRRRYANAALLLASRLDPPDLLDRLQAIESDFGARRGQRWSARTLDLDIILWSEGAWDDDHVTVPHPAYRSRDFVLAPLTQIAGDWRDPVTHRLVRHHHALVARRRPSVATASRQPAPRC